MKNKAYELESLIPQGLINNLDYHVHHYPRFAWPLHLENPTQFYWKGMCE